MVYENYLVNDFPKEEVKPFFSINRMWEEGGYEVLGLFQDEELLAYAFLAACPDTKSVLLDYYAVLERYRGGGLGTDFLKSMKIRYQDQKSAIIIETEDIHFAETQEQIDERQRRDAFYERNGVVKTSLAAKVFDANFRVWYFPVMEDYDETICEAEYEKIYEFMLADLGFEDVFELNHTV